EFEAYSAALPDEHRATLLGMVAGRWVPAAAAAAHYAACGSLGLSPEEQIRRGRSGIASVGESMVGTAIRMARGAGATPWTFFPHVNRMWRRGYDGGGCAVYRVGPKDARLDLVGFLLCTIPYYRRSFFGWTWQLLQLFAPTLVLTELERPA